MIDQQNKKRTNDDKQKELAIGRSKFNQSMRVERWSRQLANYEKSAPLQHSPGTLLDPDATDIPDESLREPLLDGGQCESTRGAARGCQRECEAGQQQVVKHPKLWVFDAPQ